MDDLDHITEPGKTWLLAYDCGCSIKIVDTWAVEHVNCDDPCHAFMGTQPDG